MSLIWHFCRTKFVSCVLSRVSQYTWAAKKIFLKQEVMGPMLYKLISFSNKTENLLLQSICNVLYHWIHTAKKQWNFLHASYTNTSHLILSLRVNLPSYLAVGQYNWLMVWERGYSRSALSLFPSFFLVERKIYVLHVQSLILYRRH